MDKLLSFVIIMTCWAGTMLAQDGRNRYGDSLKFVYIRGHEEGPDLEGEFGVPENCFHFRGILGGVFIPIKFRMEAVEQERRFMDKIKLHLKCYYTPPVRMAIADVNRSEVAKVVPVAGEDYEYAFSIGALPPGRYSLNVYSPDDSLVQSIWFTKPRERRRW